MVFTSNIIKNAKWRIKAVMPNLGDEGPDQSMHSHSLI